jgi:hypothetical protein
MRVPPAATRTASSLLLVLIAACGRRALGPAPGTAGAPTALPPSEDRPSSDDAATPTPPPDASISVDGSAVSTPDETPPVDAALDPTPFKTDAAALPPERYRAIDVAAGEHHTCALLDDHRVKCWGENLVGQLGLGDTKARYLPADMGDNLPTVDLGTGRTAKAIAAGRDTSCAILDDDSVKCWGQDGGNAGSAPGQMGDALAPLDLGEGRHARLVAVGTFGLCVVRDDETIRCMGTPPRDFPAPSAAKIAGLVIAGGNPTVLLDDGSVSGPLTPSGVAVTATAIAADQSGVCIAYADGEIICNGGRVTRFVPPNEQFSALSLTELQGICALLGDGRVGCDADPPSSAPWGVAIANGSGVWVVLGQPAVAITSGTLYHFCAALANGEVKCWLPGLSGAPGQGGGGIGDSVPTADGWPSVNLGTRPH